KRLGCYEKILKNVAFPRGGGLPPPGMLMKNICTANSAHQALVERIKLLHHFVRFRIPQRFKHLVSADDILQEVWIAAHAQFEQMQSRGPAELDRWLMAIAKRELIDALRAARASRHEKAAAHLARADQRMTSYTGLFSRLQARAKTPSRELR